MTIAAGMLVAGTPISDVDISGASHPHFIDLSADDVDALLAGDSVTVTSTPGGPDGHTHDVTVSC